MLASVILGGLALVFAQLLQSSMQGSRSVQNSVDFSTLKSNITMIVKNPDLCAKAFKVNRTTNMTFLDILVDQSVPELWMGTQLIAKPGLPLGGGMKIKALTLRQTEATKPIGGGKHSHPSILKISVEKAAGSMGGAILNNEGNEFLVDIVTTGVTSAISACNITSALPVCASGNMLISIGGGNFACENPVACGAWNDKKVRINDLNRMQKCALQADGTWDWERYKGPDTLGQCQLVNETRTKDYSSVGPNQNADGQNVRVGNKASDTISLGVETGTSNCSRWIKSDAQWNLRNEITESRICIVCP